MSKKRFDVIVVGELNVDLILNSIDSFPEMGKEKIAKDMTLTLGSSSAIFASNLSALGASVAFVGKIGDDAFGNLVKDSLRSKKVNTDFLIMSKAFSTGATIVLNYSDDRAMVTYPGAMEDLTIDDINQEIISLAKHLHFSSYFLQPGIQSGLLELFKMAKEKNESHCLGGSRDFNKKSRQKQLNVRRLALPGETRVLVLGVGY